MEMNGALHENGIVNDAYIDSGAGNETQNKTGHQHVDTHEKTPDVTLPRDNDLRTSDSGSSCPTCGKPPSYTEAMGLRRSSRLRKSTKNVRRFSITRKKVT